MLLHWRVLKPPPQTSEQLLPKLDQPPSMALRPVLEQSPETLCLVPSVWSNSLQLPVWCVGCVRAHLQLLPLCEHLNEGWIAARVYSTTVRPPEM